MKNQCLIGAILLVISTTTNAALWERLDGQAFYDDQFDLTWLTDANHAKTNGYLPAGGDGLMNWADANTWADGLVVNGVSGWRLPDMDGSCPNHSNGTCNAGEMADIYFTTLGKQVLDPHPSTGPFINFIEHINGRTWSATESSIDNEAAWVFGMVTGGIGLISDKEDVTAHAWAVHSGDVAVVPLPAAAWLFISALGGLIVAKRKQLKA